MKNARPEKPSPFPWLETLAKRPAMKFSRPSALKSLVLGAVLAALACSKSKQEEVQAPPPSADDADDSSASSGMGVMAEVGGLNEEKVEKTFKRLQPGFTDCLMAGLGRVEFLGGEVRFLVQVSLDGHAEGAFIEHSTLGDAETERCMLDRIQATTWPKPVGGRIGLARSGLTFDVPNDVRAPVAWTSNNVADALSRNQANLNSCGPGGPFEITAYVDTSGAVLAAGIAYSDAASQAAAECHLDRIREIKFSSPGSWPAKVTFKR
jgi:hypothetical protein